MGYKLVKVGNTPNVPYEEWICDTLQDFNDYIDNRNSPPGSTCYIIKNEENVGEKRIKKVDGKWEKYFESSGGGSYDDTELRNRIAALESNNITMAEIIELLVETGYITDEAIQELLSNYQNNDVLI